MAPFLAFALALFAADEAPVATSEPAAPPAAAAPAAAPKPPPQAMGSSPVAPPEDDYGYVAWCYGAISAYVELYDRAMPEVIRIERAWPTPSTEENINEVYPGQKKESIAELKLFVRAMTAAEKASAKPIQQYGAASIKRGRSVWQGADAVSPAQLAQFWMSWSPPARCEDTARTLEKKAKLMGQALTYNTEPEAKPDAAPPADAAAPAPDAPPADAAAASDVMSGLANPAMTEAPGPDAPAPEAPPADAAPAPEAEPETAPAADAPTANAEKAPEAAVAPSEPTEADKAPETAAGEPAAEPAQKGDATSATGFKPRKKKLDLRGPQ
jgi:hypothetical protein